MFNLFKRKSGPQPIERVPRGVLPTYVTNEVVVLGKAAPVLRNTYEIRLALYMAKSKGLRFILAVRPQTAIEGSVSALLQEHGGKVEETQLNDFSVYFGHAKTNGEEEGWVLGDAAAMTSLTKAIQTPWLRERLQIGSTFKNAELGDFEVALLQETIVESNIDGENVRDALLALVRAARQDGGTVFVQ